MNYKFKALVTIELIVEGNSEEEAYLRIERMRHKLGDYDKIKIDLTDITPERAYQTASKNL